MSNYIVWDTETQRPIYASNFPTKESAEAHIKRTVKSRNLPGVETSERFKVVEVPDAT